MADGGWWDHVEEPRGPGVTAKARKLVNVLSHMPGTRDAKLRWLVANIPLMEAELQADGMSDPQRAGGKIVSLTIRWWRRQSAQRRTIPESETPVQESARQVALRAAHERLQEKHPDREHFTVAELEEEAAGKVIPMRSTGSSA